MFNKPVDKVNMSLDDIIKMNKKKGPKTNGNFQDKTKPKRIGQNNRQRQNNRRQNGNHQQNVSRKPFGMLNKSKTIQKRKQPTQTQQKQTNNRRPIQAQFVGNRRRRPNNNNRTKKFTDNFNRFKKNDTAKSAPPPKSMITIIPPARDQKKVTPQKPLQRSNRKQLAPAVIKSKIAMQSARKNVQKAKKLLIARKQPAKQLMTQHFASKLGIISPKQGLTKQRVRPVQRPLQQPKKQMVKPNARKTKMLSVSIANKINRVNRAKSAKSSKSAFVKKPVAVKALTQTSKKPVLIRARPQGAPGLTSSRMVFF